MVNRIGWCDMTWNPVWGCLNHCEYCYARKMADRFAGEMADKELVFKDIEWKNLGGLNKKQQKEYCSILYPLMDFQPTWLESNFNKKFPKKSQRIFVGSMSEIAHWEAKWVNKVIFKIFEYPQHTFQFLTKFPEVYLKYDFPENCWLGVTITKQEDIDYNWRYFFNIPNREYIKFFFSFEPLLGRIKLSFYLSVDMLHKGCYQLINWVIIGAETGNRKDKIIPKIKWIEGIVNYCRENNIPIYLKDSLKDIYPVEIKEFPI